MLKRTSSSLQIHYEKHVDHPEDYSYSIIVEQNDREISSHECSEEQCTVGDLQPGEKYELFMQTCFAPEGGARICSKAEEPLVDYTCPGGALPY